VASSTTRRGAGGTGSRAPHPAEPRTAATTTRRTAARTRRSYSLLRAFQGPSRAPAASEGFARPRGARADALAAIGVDFPALMTFQALAPAPENRRARCIPEDRA